MKKVFSMLFIVLFGCQPSYQELVAPLDPLCGGDAREISAPMIINGDETDIFPEVCVTNNNCTCSLIGKTTALTAAHCVDKDAEEYFIKLSNKTEKIAVDKYIVHPKDDIALIILKDEVDWITPAILSYSAPQVDDNILLLGFGYVDDDKTVPEKLMYGCNAIDNVFYNTFRYTGVNGNGDICNGDSGGPTIIYGLLAGMHVYSSFNPFNEDKSCGKGTSTDMRIDFYLEWIIENSPDRINIGKIERF